MTNINCLAMFVFQQITPELQLSFLNRITYMYVTPLLYTGYRRLLTVDDVWLLNDCDRCEVLRNKWIRLYEPALKSLHLSIIVIY
jgi:hypothetical protein